MSEDPLSEAPDGYNFVLTAEQLDGVFEFADTLGYDVAFTLSSGLGPDVRDESGAWIPDMAEDLLAYPLCLFKLASQAEQRRFIT